MPRVLVILEVIMALYWTSDSIHTNRFFDDLVLGWISTTTEFSGDRLYFHFWVAHYCINNYLRIPLVEKGEITTKPF